MNLNPIDDYSNKITKILESYKNNTGVDYRKLLAYLPFRNTKDTAEFIFQLTVDDILNGISNKLDFLKWIIECNFVGFDYTIQPEIKTCKDNTQFLIAGIKNKVDSKKTDVLILTVDDLEKSIERRKFWKSDFANLFTIDMSSDIIINGCNTTNYKTMMESLNSKYKSTKSTLWWNAKLKIYQLTSNENFNKYIIYTPLYNDKTNVTYPLLKVSKMDLMDTNKIKIKYKSIINNNNLSLEEFKYILSILDSDTLKYLNSKNIINDKNEVNGDIINVIKLLTLN